MTPPGTAAGRTILYLHGGGYVVGTAQDYRELVSRIARAAEARALTLDYRLAPEHPAIATARSGRSSADLIVIPREPMAHVASTDAFEYSDTTSQQRKGNT